MPSKQQPLAALLAFYFVSALAYSVLCGLLGKTYHPLAALQVYTLALSPCLVGALIVGRATRAWNWRRLWPPTAPETRAALSSTLILTVSTLMYLSPQSLVAILVAQAGCLLLVARLSKPDSIALAGLSIGAVVLSVLHKPPLVAALPLGLGLAKTLGYWIKIRSVEHAKLGEGAEQASSLDRAGTLKPSTGPAVSQVSRTPADRLISPDDFLAAEQVLISLLALGVAAVASHIVKPAPLTDWRLWAVAASSLGMGLLGTRIMLRREEMGLTFPAYRMASLLAAFGAAFSRGEIAFRWENWSSWTAASLACIVVGVAAKGARSVKAARPVKLAVANRLVVDIGNRLG